MTPYMLVARSIMKSPLEIDLLRLQDQAFDRASSAKEALSRYHAAVPSLAPADAPAMLALYHWMFVPISIWPFNIQDVIESCLTILEKGRSLPVRYRLIGELLPEPPAESVCLAIAEHERHIQTGAYENLVTTQAKYSQNELAIKSDPELRRQWDRLKAAFDVQNYRDYKGLIRRSMSVERNLYSTYTVDLHRPEKAFQAAFDVFCLRWNLYGMQNDEPLPLKLAVNPTPYGTMIHIPAYWSFDPKRDIRWDAIANLHRIRVPGRQGAAIAENKAQRMRDAAKLSQLDKEVLGLRLKGEAKHQHLCNGLGWVPGTSPKRISRLRKEFENQTLT